MWRHSPAEVTDSPLPFSEPCQNRSGAGRPDAVEGRTEAQSATLVATNRRRRFCRCGGRVLDCQAFHTDWTIPPKPAKFAVVPPAGFALEGAASRQSFALSPDGAHLAFTAMDSSGEFSVFVRDLNSLQPRLVPGTEGAHTVFWPPDGRSLYLTANGKLWRTPLDGDATSFWPTRRRSCFPERG